MLTWQDSVPDQSAVVLLSSGLDSTVNFFAANKVFGKVQAITFHYGQKAFAKEIEHSRALSRLLGVDHRIIELPWFGEFKGSALTDQLMQIPQSKSVAIDDLSQSQETAKAVWVPNRNGVFLNIAASFAEANGAQFVVPGFNSEEALTFPDNSIDFMTAMDKSLSYSTSTQVRVQCFTSDLNKTQIVQLGLRLEVPFEMVWPCYFGDSNPCGQCESCLRFQRAMREGIGEDK